jgi:hypothetical protein
LPAAALDRRSGVVLGRVQVMQSCSSSCHGLRAQGLIRSNLVAAKPR